MREIWSFYLLSKNLSLWIYHFSDLYWFKIFLLTFILKSITVCCVSMKNSLKLRNNKPHKFQENNIHKFKYKYDNKNNEEKK
jgi:membrane protein insertase Oxa1/YidC/SpoIIIJ